MSIIAYIVCAVVWGTTWYGIRVCIEPGGYPEYAAAALRFTIASVILAAIWALGWARPGPRTRRELVWMGVAGLANGASYAMVYTAEVHISGGLTAVLFGTFPLMLALFASVTRTERVPMAAVAGAVVSVVGIALVFWNRLQVSGEQAGAVLTVMGAVVASAVYSLIVKREASNMHPLAATGAFLGTTSVVLWIVAAFADSRSIPWPPPTGPTIALLYLGIIGSVIVFACYFLLLKRVSLMTVGTLVFVQPMIALFVDALWEEEVRLDGLAYAGGVVILLGVALNVFSASNRRRAGKPS